MSLALCPVCEQELDFLPWDGDSASDEICPFCGIGYHDVRADLRQQIYGEWRRVWIANGRRRLTGKEKRQVGPADHD